MESTQLRWMEKLTEGRKKGEHKGKGKTIFEYKGRNNSYNQMSEGRRE